MKYSIEIGKIVEGSIKHDQIKVKNYVEQLIKKLEEDGDIRTAKKFRKILETSNIISMMPLNSNINNIPVDGESRVALADIIFPNENNIETILSPNNESQIYEFINNYQHADELRTAGLDISNTLLLFGPPGCGKTNCAYMIAKKLDLPLVNARLDSLISSYLGTTAKNIRSLFEYAQKTPCVLFLDEFDAIAKARDDANELGELKRVVNSLLQNIDSINDDCLVIAATNHEVLLDSAVWRRFDYKIKIELPNLESIKKLIKLFLKGTLDLTDKELTELSLCLEGKSGSLIKEILNKALRNAIIKGEKISKQIIYNEIFMVEKISFDDGHNDKNIQTLRAKYLRSKNISSKIFTLESIGDIIGLSKGQVSNLLNEED